LTVFVHVRPVEHKDEHYFKLLFRKITNLNRNNTKQLNVFIRDHHNNKLLKADLPVFVCVGPVEHQDELDLAQLDLQPEQSLSQFVRRNESVVVLKLFC
jgi:hypothetical protein